MPHAVRDEFGDQQTGRRAPTVVELSVDEVVEHAARGDWSERVALDRAVDPLGWLHGVLTVRAGGLASLGAAPYELHGDPSSSSSAGAGPGPVLCPISRHAWRRCHAAGGGPRRIDRGKGESIGAGRAREPAMSVLTAAARRVNARTRRLAPSVSG